MLSNNLYVVQEACSNQHLGSSGNMPRAGNSDHVLFLATE